MVAPSLYLVLVKMNLTLDFVQAISFLLAFFVWIESVSVNLHFVFLC